MTDTMCIIVILLSTLLGGAVGYAIALYIEEPAREYSYTYEEWLEGYHKWRNLPPESKHE